MSRRERCEPLSMNKMDLIAGSVAKKVGKQTVKCSVSIVAASVALPLKGVVSQRPLLLSLFSLQGVSSHLLGHASLHVPRRGKEAVCTAQCCEVDVAVASPGGLRQQHSVLGERCPHHDVRELYA